MKTNKFENTIRQKLESISPDFHEDNWARMQQFMQAQNPPTFWQKNASWLGYAAAASVTTVMAIMYTTQLSQNSKLATDVAKLKNQIEILNVEPVALQKRDTVYMVQKEVSKDEFLSHTAQTFGREQYSLHKRKTTSSDFVKSGYQVNPLLSSVTYKNATSPSIDKQPDHPTDYQSVKEQIKEPAQPQIVSSNEIQSEDYDQLPETVYLSSSDNFTKTLDASFPEIKTIKTTPLSTSQNVAMTYGLASRLTPRQAKKVWLTEAQAIQQLAYESKKAEKNRKESKFEKTSRSEKLAKTEIPTNTENPEKAENIIPQLNIKTPYRFGLGYHFEGPNEVKTVVGEVLVSKKFSISSGFSWLRIKPMQFINEKVFRDKTRKDFVKTLPEFVVPAGLAITNIHVKPSLVQIPLTVAFRNEMSNDFSFFFSAGTNITVRGKNAISFDYRFPTTGHEFRSKSIEKNMDLPLFNSANLSAGIEKAWHPIVVQIEGYFYTYFKPLTTEDQATGPGLKLKLLYQIGKKM